VNLLADWMNIQESKTNAGVPGLATLPIIGKFFGTDHSEKTQANY